MSDKNAQIVCIGGWKYTGKILETKHSFTGNLEWIAILTKTKRIQINAQHIIAIMFSNDNSIKNRKRT